MANYQHYLSEAEKKIAGVSDASLKVTDAYLNASLLAIAYAIMAVAKAITSIVIPQPQRARSSYWLRSGRQDVTINVNFRGMNKKKMEEAAEVVVAALRNMDN